MAPDTRAAPNPPPARRRRAAASHRLLSAAVACAALLSGAVASAAEFRSVGSAAAILYDGPSRQAVRLFVAPRGMPLEVVSTLGQWVKVRDMAGDVVWIERPDLAERRTLVASTVAAVRQSPQDDAPIVLHVDRGVLLELVDAPAPAAGWLPVRHRNGATGFVRGSEVWGH
jgi:SH3-like domain-containing protein